jgi:hypothetical protein
MQPVVTGWTCAANFPVGGTPFDATFNGPCDAFVVRLHAAARSLSYGTFLGGYDDDAGQAVTIGPLRLPVVTGRTRSPDFPVSPDAAQAQHQSPETWDEGFLTRVAPPTFCTTLSPGGDLSIGTWPDCTPGPPPAGGIDIIEGRLEALGAATLGEVWRVGCDVDEVLFATATTPAPGFALFQVARTAGGAYIDGAGPGLAGARIPASGDCP